MNFVITIKLHDNHPWVKDLPTELFITDVITGSVVFAPREAESVDTDGNGEVLFYAEVAES